MSKNQRKRIVNNQFNMFNQVEVNSNHEKRYVGLFDITILKKDPSQTSLFDVDYSFLKKDIPLNSITDDAKISQTEFKFLKYDEKENYYFFMFANKKDFDKALVKLYKDNDELDTRKNKYIFEHITFLILSLKTHTVSALKNKSANSWNKAFNIVFNAHNMIFSSVPYKNKNYANILRENKKLAVEFSTTNTEEIKTYSKIESDGENTIEKATVILKLNRYAKELTKEKYIESIANKRERFTDLKIELENAVYDVLKETLSKQVEIKLPEDFTPGTANMYELEKILYNEIKSLTN